MAAVEIKRSDDDHTEVWVDGVLIVSTNYDDVGRHGLAMVEYTAQKVAYALSYAIAAHFERAAGDMPADNLGELGAIAFRRCAETAREYGLVG